VSTSTETLESLLLATALGDRAAFERFYRDTSPKLFGIVRRILKDNALAEEALQDVFVRIWQMSPSFDATRGSPLAWAATLARYRAIDLLRRGAARDAPAPEHERPEQAEITPGLDFGDRDALMHCLDLLSEEQRQCVMLAYCDGYSREELGARFARPVGTIKSWLSRSLTGLRQCLSAHD
jgi:RNA polymerase sigma factor (sigma-70 family)